METRPESDLIRGLVIAYEVAHARASLHLDIALSHRSVWMMRSGGSGNSPCVPNSSRL